MKKLKLNLIAIAALAIAAVTMSFEMTGRTTETVGTKYWFQMNTAGTAPLPGPISHVDVLCPEQLEKPDCARLYDESQTVGTGSSRTVIAGQINNFEDFRSKQ